MCNFSFHLVIFSLSDFLKFVCVDKVFDVLNGVVTFSGSIEVFESIVNLFFDLCLVSEESVWGVGSFFVYL